MRSMRRDKTDYFSWLDKTDYFSWLVFFPANSTMG